MNRKFATRIKSAALFLVAAILFTPLHHALGWWDCGHHVVASIAYDKLSPVDRETFLELLTHHPRYAEDFSIPDTIQDDKLATGRWLFGVAAYWPDVARKHPTWSRPKWHYQLGATLTIGRPNEVKVPNTPPPLPSQATLSEQELHIEQAVILCRKVLTNIALPKSERAIALCWLMHLYGDAHQPCHAGSLYTAETFPEGDRGANSIRIKDAMSVHAIWDSQLGRKTDPDSIRKRTLAVASDPGLMLFALRKTRSSHPKAWLQESRELAKRYVYPVEILAFLPSAKKDDRGNVELPTLSKNYYDNAARISRQQAAVAGTRLHHALRNIALRYNVKPGDLKKLTLPPR